MTIRSDHQPLTILYHHRIRSKDGQFVHLEEMVKALRGLGHEVELSGPAGVERDDFGTSGKLVPFLKKLLPKALYEMLELGYSIGDYRRLCKRIRETNPDLIYERFNLLLPSGIWAKKKYRLPLLLEVNAPIYEERKEHDGLALAGMAHWSQTYCWRNADINLPVTNVLADYVRKAGVTEDRIQVIQNAINLADFENALAPAKAKVELGVSEQLVLGFVGFVREWHGLDRVIKMLAEPELERASLVVVGDGPASPSLCVLAVELGVSDRVHLLGLRARKDIPNLIAAFDIALQPHVVPYASPLKIFEYMALAKPIVAPNSANIREILEHGSSALLFDPSNDQQFRDCVLRLVHDQDLRQSVGANARKLIDIEGISWPSNAGTVVHLARQQLERANIPPPTEITNSG